MLPYLIIAQISTRRSRVLATDRMPHPETAQLFSWFANFSRLSWSILVLMIHNKHLRTWSSFTQGQLLHPRS